MSARSERFVVASPWAVIVMPRSKVVVAVSCYLERRQKAPAWLRGRTSRKSTPRGRHLCYRQINEGARSSFTSFMGDGDGGCRLRLGVVRLVYLHTQRGSIFKVSLTALTQPQLLSCGELGRQSLAKTTYVNTLLLNDSWTLFGASAGNDYN